jgi:hypothetical protein
MVLEVVWRRELSSKSMSSTVGPLAVGGSNGAGLKLVSPGFCRHLPRRGGWIL